MFGFVLRSGSAFDWDGVGYRIERMAPSKQVVLERMSDGQISLCTQDELLVAYRNGLISSGSTSSDSTKHAIYGRPLQDLPAHIHVELQRRVAYIRGLESMGSFVMLPSCIDPMIRRVSQELGDLAPPSVTTIYRWYKRYQFSHDLRALIPRYDRRGSSALRQPDITLELCADAVQEAFQASPAATGKSVHDRLWGKIQEENRGRLPTDQLVVPSLRTVFRMMDRLQAYDIHVMRHGKASADKRFSICKTGPEVSHILERVEVDHTPLDLFLVDERTWLPFGRPLLTLFIDDFSRFPLGYHLSFGGTSAAAVMAALKHAVLPKEKACEVIPDLPIVHNWPCYGLIKTLVCDNGLEFHGTELESVALDLGMIVQLCPKYRPNFKGKIERYIKTVNYSFAHQIPGTSLAKLADRGDYNPQKDALLTMAEFKHLLEKWLLDVYAQTIHRSIKTPPWAKWNEGLERWAPVLPDVNLLKVRIGLAKERSLRHDGITLNGLRYAGQALTPILQMWGPGTKVRVVFDPDDLGTIQVWPPHQQDPVAVDAVALEYAKGLTLYQHQLLQELVREKGKSAEDTKALMESRYQLAKAIDTMMHSRKQRSRRKAAHMHGVSSAKPDARFQAPTQPSASQSILLFKGDGKSDDLIPAPFATFKLEHGRSHHDS